MRQALFDHGCMDLALRLAARARGRTYPNPRVGAVIVKGGKIVAQGYHRRFGGPHAEILALRQAGKLSRGAALYVTLEPCCHFGKTPPCTSAIIKAGIRRVVFSTLDPSPKVSGKGAAALREAGIKVRQGLLAKEARGLNQAYFVFHQKRRPFVALKFAASLDGKIATRRFDSKWITNLAARKFARALRGQYQAALVGVNTVIRDNPHLGARAKNCRDPLRIVLDSSLRAPQSSQIFRDANVLVVTTAAASAKKFKALQNRGISVLKLPGQKIAINRLLQALYRRKIISLLVEGGSEVLGSFADAKFVDRVYTFHAPLLVGGRQALSAVGGRGAGKIKNALRLKNVSHQAFGDNLLTQGEVDGAPFRL